MRLLQLLICVNVNMMGFQFRVIVASEFVKENSWPDLVPNLRAAIMNSDLINQSGNCEWKTINALTLLQSLIRPFQVFVILVCIVKFIKITYWDRYLLAS